MNVPIGFSQTRFIVIILAGCATPVTILSYKRNVTTKAGEKLLAREI
jgi:hypothetical protein